MAGETLEGLNSVASSLISVMVTTQSVPTLVDVTLLVSGTLLHGKRIDAEQYAEAVRAQLASFANDGSEAGIMAYGSVSTIDVEKYGEQDEPEGVLFFVCNTITTGSTSTELGGVPMRLRLDAVQAVMIGRQPAKPV